MDDTKGMSEEALNALHRFEEVMREEVIPEVVRTMDERRKAAIRQAVDDAMTPSGVKGAYQELLGHIAAIEQKNAELSEQLEWYGNLVKRCAIGTTKTPSLRAYIEQLEHENAALAAVREEDARAVNGLIGLDSGNWNRAIAYAVDAIRKGGT